MIEGNITVPDYPMTRWPCLLVSEVWRLPAIGYWKCCRSMALGHVKDLPSCRRNRNGTRGTDWLSWILTHDNHDNILNIMVISWYCIIRVCCNTGTSEHCNFPSYFVPGFDALWVPRWDNWATISWTLEVRWWCPAQGNRSWNDHNYDN